MAGSYKKIDYRLRPAKSIERKMLAESFRRLSEFGRVDLYRYVGFGSVYFSDFSLFHKLLGFKQMVSIEDASDPGVKARFEYNRPFKCVDMMFGSSGGVLPRLAWDVRSIVWLDYDGILNKEVLEDIATVTSKVPSGSILLVSVNANVPRISSDEAEGGPKTPIDTLRREVGPERVPATLDSKSLANWGTAKACRTIISNQIEETLKSRNGVLSEGSRMCYSQLYNFHYSDGAKMLTVGGIFYDEAQEHIFWKCGFKHLDFYRGGTDAYLIDPPLLTFREMRALEQLVPVITVPTDLPVTPGDADRYQKVYRYFPNFAETDI
jgi:hypothetical protein